jgi:hypothetical protein
VPDGARRPRPRTCCRIVRRLGIAPADGLVPIDAPQLAASFLSVIEDRRAVTVSLLRNANQDDFAWSSATGWPESYAAIIFESDGAPWLNRKRCRDAFVVIALGFARGLPTNDIGKSHGASDRRRWAWLSSWTCLSWGAGRARRPTRANGTGIALFTAHCRFVSATPTKSDCQK